MKFFLQLGHGMMGMTQDLISSWGEGGAVLSPRDMNAEQIRATGARLAAMGAEILVDPQCYVRDADHPRLIEHDYWKHYRSKSTAEFLTPAGAAAFIKAVGAVNHEAQTSMVIIPGLMADKVSDEWFAIHDQFVSAGVAEFGDGRALATVALSELALRDEEQIEAVVDHVSAWRATGVYLVCESPGAYLVDDPVWMANLLILASGLKLAGKFVLVGYAHHQMLGLRVAKVDGIASGTFQNVRTFHQSKFYEAEGDAPSRRKTWYYCPQALSEYSLEFMDIAKKVGVRDLMRPPVELGSTHADALFGAADPSTVDWKEQFSFRHYLTCLRGQSQMSLPGTYEDTLAQHEAQLSAAEALLKRLRRSGVLGQARDFTEFVDVNRSAMVMFDRARGPRLMRSW